MEKIFIISLPRTGTTSLCAAFLTLGYRVAHTAFSKAAIEQADVLADAPIFYDYPQLDILFPKSKFVYLCRPIEDWLSSIKGLLKVLSPRLEQQSKYFNPVLARCYINTFQTLDSKYLVDETHLRRCYEAHYRGITDYFSQRSDDLVLIDLHGPEPFKQLLSQLGVKPAQQQQQEELPHLNQDGKINDWQQLSHPNKIDPFTFGQDRRRYYQFHT